MNRKLSIEERIHALLMANAHGSKRVIESWNQHFTSPPPNRSTIHRLQERFKSTGSIHDRPRSGRPSVINYSNRLKVLLSVIEQPKNSTRRLSKELEISRTTIQRILHKEHFRTYIPRLVQKLTEDDYQQRLNFCEIMLDKYETNVNIFNNIIWTDEATFNLSGHVNRHNSSYWYQENQNIIIEKQIKKPGLTVWGGISSYGMVGPFFTTGTVTANFYLELLQEQIVPAILQKVGPELFGQVLYQNDGAPAHYAAQVRAFLDTTFPNRVIGRGSTIPMPPRSPDLTPMDFHVWGLVKDKVYSRKPETIEQLKQFITDEFQILNQNIGQCVVVVNSVYSRLWRCLVAEGKQFETL